MRIPYRLQTPLLVSMPFVLAIATAAAVVRGGFALIALFGLAALAAVVVAFSVRPQDAFLLWLLTAPFLQDVGHTRLQHVIRIVLYSAPTLLFFAWTVIQRRNVRGSFVDLLPAGYLGLAAASALVAGHGVSPTQVFAVVADGVIVYYFCAFGSFGDDLIRRVAGVILATGAIVAGLVVLGRIAGFQLGYSPDVGTGEIRAQGPFGSPGYLGMFLGVGLALAIAVLGWNGPRSLRRLSILCVVVIPPALFLTLTRGPQIAAGAVALLLLLARARSRWPSILAVILAALVLAGVWGSIRSTSYYQNRLSNVSNIQSRQLISRWSLELAGRKPLLGWGYGSFDRVKNSANLSSGSLPRAFGINYTSHNTFLTILVELGGVGLSLLLVPWLVVAGSAIRRARFPTPERWAFIGLIGILAIWIVNAGTIDMRFFPFACILPWLAVGLLRRMALDDQQSPERSGHPRTLPAH